MNNESDPLERIEVKVEKKEIMDPLGRTDIRVESEAISSNIDPFRQINIKVEKEECHLNQSNYNSMILLFCHLKL